MRYSICILSLAVGITLPAFSQSSLVFDAGTIIDVSADADICADLVTINGSFSGSGTRCGTSVPVTLVSFAVRVRPGSSGAILEWRTISEVNNYGFTVQVRLPGEPGYADLAGSFVAGHGTTTAPHSYDYTVTGRIEPKTFFRLDQIDFDGTVHFSEPVTLEVTGVTEPAPAGFALAQNFPNPFNPTTAFVFSVKKSGLTRLIVYSLLGEEVATIFNGVAEPGRYYHVRFDGKDLASGVYYARLQSGDDNQMRKVILMK